mgnify:CR=1 FL=1
MKSPSWASLLGRQTALIRRAEKSTTTLESAESGFTLYHTAALLEDHVRERTLELEATLAASDPAWQSVRLTSAPGLQVSRPGRRPPSPR